MKFKTNHIKLKSNWFDSNGIVFKIGYDAFLLYLTLYRFFMKSYNEDEEDCIATSIYYLRKQSKFTKKETFELFKKLESHKLIKSDVTRWDRYTEKELMIIKLLDLPQTERTAEGKDKNISTEDYYVSVNLELVQYYIDCGFSGKEIAFYCLIKKLSNNTERKSWISINETADKMNMSSDTVTKMIRNLNRNYLLATYYRKNSQRGKDSYKFEHYILNNMSELEIFKKIHADNIEKNIKKWDKQAETKQKQRDKAKVVECAVVNLEIETIEHEEKSNSSVIKILTSFGKKPTHSMFDESDNYNELPF